MTLLTEQGERTFPVAGIYYDYASSQGTVMLALPLYRALIAAREGIWAHLPTLAAVQSAGFSSD